MDTQLTTPIYWPQPGARPPRPRYVPLRFRSDGWVIALTVLTTLGVLLTVALWIYLVYRIVKSRSRIRTIWPGQVLLLGILATYVLLYAFLPRQTPSSCGVIRFGVGCAYAVIFATLLLKLLVTIARHKGVFLPVTVEILLLILAIGVQVAISANWLIVQPPIEKMLIYRNGNTACNIGLYSWLHSLGYVMLLIVVGLVTSVAARKIKDNHREPVFIGLAFGFSAPLWLVWILVCALMPNEPNIDEKCLAFGLLANATLVLFAMFIPKVRQLSAIGAVGLYREDRPIPKTMTEMSVQKIYYPVYPENGTRPSQLDVGRYMRHLYGSTQSVQSTDHSPTNLHLPRFHPYHSPFPDDKPDHKTPDLTTFNPNPNHRPVPPLPSEDGSTTASYRVAESLPDTDSDLEMAERDFTRRSRPQPNDMPTYAQVSKHMEY
uniref:G-protein coupled receptors family 3 profile domain-containing protein n=1 Tax=Strigamia maritima TaxID=126957 RepID=T1JC74_STRMM